MYCTGLELLLLENGWSDVTDRGTSGLSSKCAAQRGKFRPLYILNFVLSEANQNEDSTGLAPRMTSVTWPSHVTWESSVFIMLIHTWRQMTSDDVRWRYHLGSWVYCSVGWRRCPYKAGESVMAALVWSGCKQIVNMFELAQR